MDAPLAMVVHCGSHYAKAVSFDSWRTFPAESIYALMNREGAVKGSHLAVLSVVAAMFAAEPVSASDEWLKADITQKRLPVSAGKSTIGRSRSAHQKHARRPVETAAVIFQPASRSSILLPDPELLKRQPPPDCQFKPATSADDDVALRTIMKLDYEQQCYRQSESIMRSRMERLQDAVNKTIESFGAQNDASGPERLQ
jgi:hypothetical protein